MGERLHKREKKKKREETSNKNKHVHDYSHTYLPGKVYRLDYKSTFLFACTYPLRSLFFYCCILCRFHCLFVCFRSFMVLSVLLFLVWILLRNIARLDSRESIEKCDRRRLCTSARSWKVLTKGEPCTRQFLHPFAITCPSNKHNFPSCMLTCAANRFVSSIAECLLCDVAKPCFPQRTTTCAPFL